MNTHGHDLGLSSCSVLCCACIQDPEPSHQMQPSALLSQHKASWTRAPRLVTWLIQACWTLSPSQHPIFTVQCQALWHLCFHRLVSQCLLSRSLYWFFGASHLTARPVSCKHYLWAVSDLEFDAMKSSWIKCCMCKGGSDDYLGSLAEHFAVKHQLWCRLSSHKSRVSC